METPHLQPELNNGDNSKTMPENNNSNNLTLCFVHDSGKSWL